MQRSTSSDHVQDVLAITDPVLRNYWVTQTYADLSAGIAAVLGPGLANWCTYATWASRTVGRNLRGEELPEWLHRRVVMSDGMMGLTRGVSGAVQALHPALQTSFRILPEHVGDVLRTHFGACSSALSEGNTKVFAEIAPAAAVFLGSYGGALEPSAARKQVLDACAAAPEFDGVNRLEAGFTHWCDAASETDPRKKSQLILAGSLQLGAHEQNRLQDQIAESMNMGLDRSIELLEKRMVRLIGDPAELEESIDRAFHPLGGVFQELWGELMTTLLGVIELPEGTFRLDRDLPPVPGEPYVPADLEPVVAPELDELLAAFNRADGSGRGSAAPDWVDLGDRMNYITNLFRSRHHRTTLSLPPLAAEDLAAIEQDRAPAGPQGPPAGSEAARQPGADPFRPAGPSRPIPAPPPSKGIDQFDDAFVEKLRTVGDPPADAAVDEFIEATDIGHQTLFRRLSVSPASVADEDLPGIGEFVRQVEPWPSWADPELVRAGQAVFGEYGPQLGMGLFMASLPADYAFARGVQVLANTTRLTRDPKRRYVETGQMIVDAMTPGWLDPGQRGYRTVRHVRLMHAAVRHVLLHVHELGRIGPEIAPLAPTMGTPISQLQLLGTLFSFSVQGIQSLERLGVHLSQDRAEAYIHVWNLVGYQIGIMDGLLPLSWEDSQTLWDTRRQTEYGPTPEGRELTAAAIECMRDLFRFTHLPGLPSSGIRFYLGDQTADYLGVPASDWTRLLLETMRWVDRGYAFTLGHLLAAAPLASWLGRRVWQGFEQYGRAGQRPSFEVSDELRAAWGLDAWPLRAGAAGRALLGRP